MTTTVHASDRYENLAAHPRVRAWRLIRDAFPALSVRFDREEGGDHVFHSASGAEVRVDLVLCRVTRAV